MSKVATPVKTNGHTAEPPPVPAVSSNPTSRFKALLEKSRGQIEQALPRHLTPERMMSVATMAVYKTPKLQECDPMSIVACVVQASELGLEPGGALGHGYLIPRWNKNSRSHECTFLPGYKGLLELARRSGQLLSVQARVVHESDTFSFAYGLEPTLTHVPRLGGDRGKLVAVYATAKLRSGETALEVMSVEDVNLIRSRSQSRDSGPWVTDYSEMAKKTVLRRLLKLLPCSIELARAFEYDNTDYEPDGNPNVSLVRGSGTRSAQLADRLGAPALDAPDEPTFEPGTSGQITTEAEPADVQADLDLPEDATPTS